MRRCRAAARLRGPHGWRRRVASASTFFVRFCERRVAFLLLPVKVSFAYTLRHRPFVYVALPLSERATVLLRGRRRFFGAQRDSDRNRSCSRFRRRRADG